MRLLTFRPMETAGYGGEVDRIVFAAHTRGYVLTHGDARAAWQAYSDSMAAGWMHMPEDEDELWANVFPYLFDYGEIADEDA